MNKDSTPLSIFMLYFLEIIQLLLEPTNRYYWQYLETLNKRQFPLLCMILQEMFLFLAITLQLEHDQRDTLKLYWTTLQQFFSPFMEKL
jgi:hypothetical protein